MGEGFPKNTLSLKNKKILSSRKNDQFWGCISQFINYAKNDSKTTLKLFYAHALMGCNSRPSRRLFPYPTITPRECYSINRIRHNRGKACLSGKRRALEGSPKIYCGSTSFCHSYRTRTGSNTRKLSKSKEVFVVL